MKKDIERRIKRALGRSILHTLGPVAPRATFDGPLQAAVVLAQEKLGDAVLLTPLLRNLRRAFPGLRLDVVTYGPNFDFFAADPNVSMVHRGKREYLRTYRALKARNYDLLFSTKDHASFTFLYQSRVIPARYRVGILHPAHHGYFHHLIPIEFHRHVIEKNCALLGFLGIPYDPEDLRPHLPEGPVRDEVRAFTASLAGRGAIGVNLSAGSEEREWPIEKWEAALRELPGPVVVTAVGRRLADKARLEAGAGNVVPSPETRSIHEAGALVAALRTLVSPDTALVHVASCFRVPVVGLYRSDPVHLKRFYPYLVPHELVVSPTDRVADVPVRAVVEAVRRRAHAGVQSQ